MSLNFMGLIAGIAMIALTGIGHIIVIKGEYHFSERIWPLFLFAGLACLAGSFFTGSAELSAVLGIAAATFLWGIGELFHQTHRVKKGQFPKKKPKKGGKK